MTGLGVFLDSLGGLPLTVGTIAEGLGIQGVGEQSLEPVLVDNWLGLQAAIDEAENGQEIKLSGYVLCYGWDRIKVEGKTITIDLNGNTLDRNLMYRTSFPGPG